MYPPHEIVHKALKHPHEIGTSLIKALMKLYNEMKSPDSIA